MGLSTTLHRTDLLGQASDARACAECMARSDLQSLMLDIARQYEDLADQIDQLHGLNRAENRSER